MVRLDLDRINKNSPYSVISTNDSSCYKFVTDYNINYAVSFLEDELLLNCESYQFIIANTNNKKSPRDPKLRLSIMAIIHEFFESTKAALLYICETGDSRQSMRNRLFEFWFNSSPRKSEFIFISANIEDAEGVQNYVAIISRLDNPQLKEVVSEFTEKLCNYLARNQLKPDLKHQKFLSPISSISFPIQRML